MMPTFPRSPLSFRTTGFPQYGCKADISDGAFPDIASLRLLPAYTGKCLVCVRPPDRAYDRHGAGTRQDWLAEPGLQHSPPCDAGAHRHRMRVKSARSIRKGRQVDKRQPAWWKITLETSSALIANHA